MMNYWEQCFSELERYKEGTGHCLVPARFEENKQLAYWVINQRKAYKSGNMSSEQKTKLDSIGFVWDVLDQEWNKMYERLAEYKDINGDCLVPRRYKDDPKLGRWVQKQRVVYNKGLLDPAKKNKLDQLGFIWDVHGQTWVQRFNELAKYRERHGHCLVPLQDDLLPELGTWVSEQRKAYRNGKLSKERMEKLNSLDFCWEPFEDAWNKKFEELKEYQDTHKNCLVPNRYEQNPSLGFWVGDQRKAYKNGQLDKTKVDLLEGIGFTWDVNGDQWAMMYEQLAKFKQVEGHFSVPKRRNRALATWVQHQKAKHEHGEMSQEQYEKLAVIGFFGDPARLENSEQWETFWLRYDHFRANPSSNTYSLFLNSITDDLTFTPIDLTQILKRTKPTILKYIREGLLTAIKSSGRTMTVTGSSLREFLVEYPLWDELG